MTMEQAIDRYRARFTDKQRYTGDPFIDDRMEEENILMESIFEAINQIKERLDSAKVVVESNSSKKKKKMSDRSEKILSNLEEAFQKTDSLGKAIKGKTKLVGAFVSFLWKNWEF